MKQDETAAFVPKCAFQGYSEPGAGRFGEKENNLLNNTCGSQLVYFTIPGPLGTNRTIIPKTGTWEPKSLLHALFHYPNTSWQELRNYYQNRHVGATVPSNFPAGTA